MAQPVPHHQNHFSSLQGYQPNLCLREDFVEKMDSFEVVQFFQVSLTFYAWLSKTFATALISSLHFQISRLD